MTAHEKLRELVAELHKECGVEIEPSFPRVLVRLLPREQKTRSGLYLPEEHQNKPTHEGIVLKVYKPFWQSVFKADDWLKVRSRQALLDEKGRVKAIWQEAQVKPGDHILFPFAAFGIMPVWPLDDGKGDYRLVPEGEILAVLDYKKQTTRDWLMAQLNLEFGLEDTVSTILEKAEVYRKDLPSLTVSGK